MDRERIALAMPMVRLEFEALKDALREGRFTAATSALFGSCLNWDQQLRHFLAEDDKATLSARDPLTRFFVTRTRGAPEEMDFTALPVGSAFLMALSAFSVLDVLMDELSLGDHLGLDEEGNWQLATVLAGQNDGSRISVDKGSGRCRFDLMVVYRNKAQALERFIAEEFDDDFDRFLWRYVADHDLDFDMEQAWRPRIGKGGENAHPCA
ncbi:hypothetical protein [Magnetospirillum sp. 64-120]|uniref:hypothetical protein n=1 Tax=Magnetospirillum sp. 64-120 TaxID=1895778 RepID=UPI0025BF632A|nr:hypothetical protein [Magnetospirillum sp. 64-120]